MLNYFHSARIIGTAELAGIFGICLQELLRRLVDAHVVVTKFELVEPSLHDIFIEQVREAA